MKIFKYNFEFKNPFKKELIQFPTMDKTFFTLPEIPIIKEIRGKDWVYFGVDNLYPQHLKRIVSLSPTQGAIIKGKAGMMAGDGLLINGTTDKALSKAALESLPPEVKKSFEDFTANRYGNNNVESIITLISRDYQTHGAFAIEVVWSLDWQKISAIKYVDVANIRTGKCINGKIKEFWYSRDWFVPTKEGYVPNKMIAFDKNSNDSQYRIKEDITDYNQIIYVKNGNLEYYGEPAYSESISWVEIEGLTSQFHLSNITQGYAPGMSIKFFQKPASPEEQKQIIEGIKKQYAGAGNAGRAMIFFSDGKDLSPEIDAIPVDNLDKKFLGTDTVTVQKILTGNQVTSPLLLGIKTDGQLGGTSELEIAYTIFNRSVIEPDRKKVEIVLNELLSINQIPITIEIMPFNPLVDTSIIADASNTVVTALNSLSPLVATKVLEAMTTEEIRNIIGLKTEQVLPPTNPPKI